MWGLSHTSELKTGALAPTSANGDGGDCNGRSGCNLAVIRPHSERQTRVRTPLFSVGPFPGLVIPVTSELPLLWLSLRAPGVTGSSSSAFPAISLGFTILGEIFAYVTVFSPTTEVATFRLCGLCMLDVFLLAAFTRRGHDCSCLSSPCYGMHMCTD